MKMFLMSYTSSAGLQNHNFSLCCYAVKEQSHLIFYVLEPKACSVSS